MCNVSCVCLLVIIELEALKQLLLHPQCAAVSCVAYTTRRSENFSVDLRNGNPEVTKSSLSYQTRRTDDSVSKGLLAAKPGIRGLNLIHLVQIWPGTQTVSVILVKGTSFPWVIASGA